MTSQDQQINSKDLEEAFALFTEASHQLSNAYAGLQQDVTSLTEQLAVANGNLKKQFEEKAVLSRRLTLLLDRLPAGVLEVDDRGMVIRCNERALGLLGESLVAKNWDDFCTVHFQETSESGLLLFESVDLKRYITVEQVQVVEEAVTVVLLHDVSASVEMRQTLQRNSRLVAMGEMAAGLAHQLRTPLAAGLLYVGHLQREQLQEADRIKFAVKASERLQRLEALVQNMLLFVRGQPQEVSPISLQEVVQDAFIEVKSVFEQQGILLQLELPNDSAVVMANFKELSGAFSNLIENACQASVAGQLVSCRVELSERQVTVLVSDRGVGISASALERLFEPFFTTKKGGTGLGLAIVRNLISSYGGEITVTSTPNLGSEFKICLPRVLETTNVLRQS
ncbi:GHKL domain-containing protein [Chitinibacter fontanus]|uniref:histidine kinase n=1 Tax=Chitinibacter fontanus TaxID=1737446 RepID=A0A7D5V7Z8_9NEIS|nr:ATP-binding protein [Chitinibacter fontanus]QLI80379.1 GHKL domain-containing protein [Chitinibacter fontanus]